MLKSLEAASDHASVAKLRDSLGVVAQDTAINSLIVFAQSRRGTVKFSSRVRELNGQTHSVNVADRAILRMREKDRIVARHNPGVAKRLRRIANFRHRDFRVV